MSKDIQTLKKFSALRARLLDSNSTAHKVQVLEEEQDPDVLFLLKCTYHPLWNYGVTGSWLLKNNPAGTCKPHMKEWGLVDSLCALRDRVVSGHLAIGLVNVWRQKCLDAGLADIIPFILDKDLKCGINTKTVLKAHGGMFPLFSVSLGVSKADPDYENERWFASRKLDGVRCVIIRDETGRVRSYTRTGKRIESIERIERAALHMLRRGEVLDGELCLIDEHGQEDFKHVMQQLRRKNHQIERAVLFGFDLIPLDVFEGNVTGLCFSERFSSLKDRLADMGHRTSGMRHVPIHLVRQILVKSVEHEAYLVQKATDYGWEGVILRKDVSYKGKRSKDIIKRKKMQDTECRVIDVETGPFSVVVDGQREQEDVMCSVVVDYKGNRVSVGSGFTIAERRKYKQDPDAVIGSVITVQFFEETKDKKGKVSLRFPIFKFNHGKHREL